MTPIALMTTLPSAAVALPFRVAAKAAEDGFSAVLAALEDVLAAGARDPRSGDQQVEREAEDANAGEPSAVLGEDDVPAEFQNDADVEDCLGLQADAVPAGCVTSLASVGPLGPALPVLRPPLGGVPTPEEASFARTSEMQERDAKTLPPFSGATGTSKVRVGDIDEKVAMSSARHGVARADSPPQPDTISSAADALPPRGGASRPGKQALSPPSDVTKPHAAEGQISPDQLERPSPRHFILPVVASHDSGPTHRVRSESAIGPIAQCRPGALKPLFAEAAPIEPPTERALPRSSDNAVPVSAQQPPVSERSSQQGVQTVSASHLTGSATPSPDVSLAANRIASLSKEALPALADSPVGAGESRTVQPAPLTHLNSPAADWAPTSTPLAVSAPPTRHATETERAATQAAMSQSYDVPSPIRLHSVEAANQSLAQPSNGDHLVSPASDRDERPRESEILMQDRSGVAAPVEGLSATSPKVAAISGTGEFARPKGVPPAEPLRQIADAIVRTRDGVVEITLDPIELGRVTVTLAMDRHASLGIVAERPATLELIRGHTDQLLRDLRDNGMPDARLDFLRGPDGAAAERHVPSPVRASIDDGRAGPTIAGGQGNSNQPSGGSSDQSHSQRPPIYDRSRTESLDTVAQSGPVTGDTTPALRLRNSGRLDLRL